MIKIKSNIGTPERAMLEPDAQRTRSMFVNGRAYSASQKKEQARRLSKKFLVKGRFEGGRRMWDVYILDGQRMPVIAGAGFVFQEEAIAFARDRALGREAVAFGGALRGVFKPGSGGVLTMSRAIEKPGDSVVKVQPTKAGVVVG